MCSIILFFLIFKNKIYNTYRDLHTRIILNNVLKITVDNAKYTNCHTRTIAISCNGRRSR